MNGKFSVGCDGKKQFRTYWQAIRSARQLNQSRDSAKAGIYKCPGCGSWHVGNVLGHVDHTHVNRHTTKELLRNERI